MLKSDRDKLDQRLRALETRRYADSGAREEFAARIEALAARMPPMDPDEARVGFLAALAEGPETPGILALRRAAERVYRL